jgi:hypothetical protein
LKNDGSLGAIKEGAMSLRSLSSRTSALAWSSIVALILGSGEGVWGALLLTNLKATPAIPWAVAVMSLFSWLMWK